MARGVMILVTAGDGHIRKKFVRKSSIQAIEPTLSYTHMQIADGLSCCLLNPSNNGDNSGGSRISLGEPTPEEGAPIYYFAKCVPKTE